MARTGLAALDRLRGDIVGVTGKWATCSECESSR
jgi:hypothetical protein